MPAHRPRSQWSFRVRQGCGSCDPPHGPLHTRLARHRRERISLRWFVHPTIQRSVAIYPKRYGIRSSIMGYQQVVDKKRWRKGRCVVMACVTIYTTVYKTKVRWSTCSKGTMSYNCVRNFARVSCPVGLKWKRNLSIYWSLFYCEGWSYVSVAGDIIGIHELLITHITKLSANKLQSFFPQKWVQLDMSQKYGFHKKFGFQATATAAIEATECRNQPL